MGSWVGLFHLNPMRNRYWDALVLHIIFGKVKVKLGGRRKGVIICIRQCLCFIPSLLLTTVPPENNVLKPKMCGP